MKRNILILSSLAISTLAMAQTFSGGTGTKADPYLISTKADLDQLSTLTDTPDADGNSQVYGKYFKLTQDIDDAYTGIIGYEGFFKGDFDGGGHCITLRQSFGSDNYVGLFGTVKDGSVHDLAVKGSVVGRNYVGAIVANPSNGAVLYNLVNYANVTSTSTSMMASVGGVIGGIVSQTSLGTTGATISNCANYGTVTSDGSAVGGVIGYSGQQVANTISDVANYGSVVGSYNGYAIRIGGAIGNPLYNDKIHRVASFGTISRDTLSGCIGNSNPTDMGEIFYDRQFAHTTAAIPAQEKNTAEMTGTLMKSELGDEWAYAEGLLPRPKMNGMENSTIAVLYATPVMLADGDWLGNVTKAFSVSLGNAELGNVAWTAKNNLVDIAADGTVTLKGSGKETLVATLNGESREVNITVNTGTDGISETLQQKATDNTWRNLNGQIVASPRHGIFIHNGKKVVLK